MRFPEVMRQAREDLLGNVSGRFSPEDWDQILVRAANQLQNQLQTFSVHDADRESKAWQNVMRDFHQSRYWGYVPDYKPPKVKKKKSNNLGIGFIWTTFISFTFTKIAVAWTGQIYSRSDQAKDKWVFLAVLVAAISNFAYFVWRHRKIDSEAEEQARREELARLS